MSKLVLHRVTLNSKHRLSSRVVMTIGNFDGVHLGHQRLLARVVEQAQAQQASSLVVTFEPPPFEYFSRSNAIPRIMRLRDKAFALANSGVDQLCILPFKRVVHFTATDFISQISDVLHPVHMVIGDDFRFGYQRQGDLILLEQIGEQLGFSVEKISTVLVDGERVSSTRVRQALAEDNQVLVRQLLGRPYSLLGRIAYGEQRGRQWRIPTANIDLQNKVSPISGVYTVYVYGIGEYPLPGVANIGVRPTIGGAKSILEVHLLDFEKDIYGCSVSVEFCKKLREEKRFANLDLLRDQINKDVLAAYRYFDEC